MVLNETQPPDVCYCEQCVGWVKRATAAEAECDALKAKLAEIEKWCKSEVCHDEAENGGMCDFDTALVAVLDRFFPEDA